MISPGHWMQKARERILAANDEMTKDALRVLGLAYRVAKDVPDNPEHIKAEELEKDLVFVGLMGMIDPARTEVRPALETGARSWHSHGHDHGRLSQYGARHRRDHWLAAAPAGK